MQLAHTSRAGFSAVSHGTNTPDRTTIIRAGRKTRIQESREANFAPPALEATGSLMGAWFSAVDRMAHPQFPEYAFYRGCDAP
jgi:hypothetical protein